MIRGTPKLLRGFGDWCPHHLRGPLRRDQAVTDDEAREQIQVATEAIRGTVAELLKRGEVDPRLLVMAAARVAGELGADVAMATGDDAEVVLSDLAGVMYDAAREHQRVLREVAEMPVAGSA